MFRYTCRRYAAPISASELVALKKKLHVRYAIDSCPKFVLSSHEFVKLCENAYSQTTGNELEAMTHQEASFFLDDLNEARVVLHVKETDSVFLRPSRVLTIAHQKLELAAFDPSNLAARQEQLKHEIELVEKQAATSIQQTAMFRKRFWAGVGVGSGLQMCLFSYWTFVVYDWDLMEPFTYFVTMATSVIFYLYFVVYRREHSVSEVDQNLLPQVFEKKLGANAVNAKRWMALLKELEANEKNEHLENPTPPDVPNEKSS